MDNANTEKKTMIREIHREDALNRLLDPNVFIMKLSSEPKGKNWASYVFIPIMDYGTTREVTEALKGDNVRVIEEVPEDEL